MADGTILNQNTTVGDKIWTEDVGSANGKLERVKLALGDMNVDGGDISATNPVPVKESVAAGVTSGQVSLSGASAALPTVAGRRFTIKADNDNSAAIYIGPSGVTSANGFPLSPGDRMEVHVTNLNTIHAIVGTGTQALIYFGEV